MWHHFSVVARPMWHSLFYNGHFSLRWVPMEAKLLKLHQTEKNPFKLYLKTFEKILFWSCCVTSLFRHCPANLTFLALQCPIFNQMSTHGSQTFQIKPNWTKKPLTRSKDLSENLSCKLLCDVVFPSFRFQSHIPCFTMPNFQSVEYP